MAGTLPAASLACPDVWLSDYYAVMFGNSDLFCASWATCCCIGYEEALFVSSKTDNLVKWLQSRPWTVFPLGKSPQGIRETLKLWVFMNWRFSGGKKIFPAFLKNRQMGTCWESFPLGDLSELYKGEEEGQALVQSMWWRNDTLLWLKLKICARVWAESIKIWGQDLCLGVGLVVVWSGLVSFGFRDRLCLFDWPLTCNSQE